MKKRLYFILSGENLFHPYYFKQTYDNLDKNKFEVIGVSIPEERYRNGFLNFLKYQVNLWGIKGFLFIAFMSNIYKTLDILKLKSTLSIKTIATIHNIPVIKVENVNGVKHLNYLKTLNIDVIISSNGQIFKEQLLNLPKIACVNRHTALLPEYGGCMPVFWAMYNKEQEFGVSLHYMVEEIDKGDILYQEPIPLNNKNSMFCNYIIAFDKSVNVTIKSLDNLLKHKIVAKFYPNNKQYFSNPETEDIQKFKEENKPFNISDIKHYFKVYHSLFNK